MKKLILSVFLSMIIMAGCSAGTDNLPSEVSPEPTVNQPAKTPEATSTQEIADESPTPEINAVAEYKSISPEDAHSRLAEDNSIILLDVRTNEEYAEGHIPGSILLPDYEVADKIETIVPDKDAEIFVYCRSGRRSKSTADIMVGLGYTNVYDLGGIQDWPFEIVSE